ncbi:hypothetical protein GCM10027093_31260 [Paraburkholderia jirisanensis]
MNIDFHYGVIYVVARLGGLDAQDARTVAHACQYIDDATTPGLLQFAGGELFDRFASAHKLFDYHNMDDDLNRLVWTPFHFLPAGKGDTLEQRAVCRPDSEVARDLVRHALQRRNTGNALHRLGVTLHTYVDTWAHQGFAGIESDYNRVTHLEAENCTRAQWLARIVQLAEHLADDVATRVLTHTLPLGHGAALSYPDLPWVKWHYVNGKDERIERENLPQFIEAADMACRVVRAFCADTDDFVNQPGLPTDAKIALHQLLESNRSMDEMQRLNVICDSVAAGAIPGVKAHVPAYVAKGEGSWKHLATGIRVADDGRRQPQWTPAFEDSDYRKFHDAVKEHRFAVVQEILPAHGLRLA